jgi:hypothetical protein
LQGRVAEAIRPAAHRGCDRAHHPAIKRIFIEARHPTTDS